MPASHLGLGLVRLLKWLAAITVCLLLLGVASIWGIGRSIPSLIDSALASKANSGLTCGQNDSNLFVGRIDLADLSVLNPPEFTQREFVHVRRLVVDVQPMTFLSDGRRVIDEVTLDLDRVTLVGKSDLFRDNNATAIAKAFRRSAKADAKDSAESGDKSPAPGFLIRHLRVRVGGVTLIQEGAGKGGVLLKDNQELAFEASDVTSENLGDTVITPLGGMALTRAASADPDVLLNAARRQMERIQK